MAETVPTGTTVTHYAFSWDVVSGGSTPLSTDDGHDAYIYGPSMFGGTAPVEQISATGTVTYLSASSRGVQLAFSASGVLRELAAYTAYGTQVLVAGTKVTAFGFQGAYTDPSGMLYMINRYYTPQAASFLSVDPLVAQTQTPYAFTGGDPLNLTDPLGLAWYYNYLRISGHPNTWIWGTETTASTRVERIYGGECIPAATHCGGPGCHHGVCTGEFLRWLATQSATVNAYFAVLAANQQMVVHAYVCSAGCADTATTAVHQYIQAVNDGAAGLTFSEGNALQSLTSAALQKMVGEGNALMCVAYGGPSGAAAGGWADNIGYAFAARGMDISDPVVYGVTFGLGVIAGCQGQSVPDSPDNS